MLVLRRLLTRRGALGAPLALVTLIGLGAAGAGLAALHVRERVAASESVVDPTPVYGPRDFIKLQGGETTIYVDSFAVAGTPGATYRINLESFAPSGSALIDSASVQLNGKEIFRPVDFASGPANLTRLVTLQPSNTVRVTIAKQSTASSTIRLTITPLAVASFTVFGAQTVTVPAGDTTATFTGSFVVPADAGPERYVEVANGDGAGANALPATAGVWVKVNGATVLTTPSLPQDGDVLAQSVTLAASNTVEVGITNGVPGGSVTVRIAASDTATPKLRIDAPATDARLNTTSATVTGAVIDHTPTALTINGTAATVGSDGSFSATVPLPAEGAHTLTLSATDAAGLQTDSTRTVYRDTELPLLALSAPADQAVVATPSVNVAGTVSDAGGGLTVAVNGVPLTVDAGGAFAGNVALAEGVNFLTVTATDGAGNESSVVRQVTLDTQAPALTVTEPLDGTSTTSSSVTVRGTVTDATALTLTVHGGSVTPDAGSAFSRTVSLPVGTTPILVVARDAAGNETTVTRTVTRAEVPLPPDPSTVAPPLDQTKPTTIAAATAFLYTGENPIQTGVAPGTIQAKRAAVLRGRVLTRAGDPLGGVTITAAGHPEFGQTLTRADGWFDLAVNGGGELRVDYQKEGLLPAQREVVVPWQDYVTLDDVVLVALDSQITTIDFSEPVEVARGSVVSDSSGTRQGTLLFEQGTTATMVLPDGTTQPLTSLDVRVTEYTVGPSGLAAMPALLPPTTAYTYAAELSADQAIAAGATEVRFSQPVAYYLENFIGFPVGTAAPLGTYDRQRGEWIPARDGRVVKILAVSGGVAELDIDGSGVAATPQALAALGVSDAERAQLATLYAVGQTLWRTEHEHFSIIDINWPLWLFPGSGPPKPPGAPELEAPKPPCGGSKVPGSIIRCEERTLGEAVPVAGTPFSLHYESDRVPGHGASYRMRIPLTGLPDTLVFRLALDVSIAGRHFRQTFLSTGNQTHTFVWDGRDAYGRPTVGQQRMKVRLGNTYKEGWYAGVTSGFGSSGGAQIVSAKTRREYTIWGPEVEVGIGLWDARAAGLGGWTLGIHHAYDPVARTVHYGSGETAAPDAWVRAITTVAGMSYPTNVAVGPDGSVFVSDRGNYRVRKIAPNGVNTIVAGNGGCCGSLGDGGPATLATLYNPQGVAVAPDGTLYISEQFGHRVRKVTPDGIITTVVGTGASGFSGDGGPATQARVHTPGGIALGRDGSLYIADYLNHRIRRVSPAGIISTVAGGGDAQNDGVQATTALVYYPSDVAVGPDGTLYVAASGEQRVRRIDTNGIIRTVAGMMNQEGYSCDGGPATQARLRGPSGVALGPDGTVYIADYHNGCIRRVLRDGTITTVAGRAPAGYSGDGGLATQAQLYRPAGLAFAPDGALYIADQWNHRVRKVAAPYPGFEDAAVSIASADGGQLHQFDAGGRHLRTLNTVTGRPTYTFSYDAVGRLASVRDLDGLVTTVERAPDGGIATAIVSPFGQRTALALDAEGYLASVTNPANERTGFTYHAGGLLATLNDARSNVHTYAYDSIGFLRRDEGPAGNFLELAYAKTDTGTTSTLTSAMGVTRRDFLHLLPTGGFTRRQIDAAGLVTTTTMTANRDQQVTYPDGTVLTASSGGDPRFGMQAPVTTAMSVTLPSGLRVTYSGSRRATLANPADPLSLTRLGDTVVVNGKRTATTYEAATRKWTTTSPALRQVVSFTDTLGRVTSSQVGALLATTYAYDTAGRLERVTNGGREVRYAYDAKGRLLSTTDPLGRSDSLFYDAADRLVRRVTPDGREVGFAYDSAGNLTGLTPPGRPAHGFDYSPIDLPTGTTPPSVGAGSWATRFGYDLDGRLTSIARPDGDSIVTAYDSAGRLATVRTATGTTTFGYSSGTGQLTGLTAPDGGTLGFTWDGALPTGTTWTGAIAGNVGFKYDTDFRVSKVAINGADTVAYTYDADGLLTTAGQLGLQRRAADGLLARDSVGAVTAAYAYTNRGEVQHYASLHGADTLLAVRYGRDSLSRITTLTETTAGVVAVRAFGYDSAGRLETVTENGQLVATYGYDANGNRTSVVTPNGTLTGVADDQDRLLSFGNATYEYTRAGELRYKIVGADTTTYTYDALGNLRAVKLPTGALIEYVTDAQNRRIGRKVDGVLVQGFLYQSQLAPAAELDGSGAVVARFVYGTRVNVPDYIVKGGVTYRVVTDHLGSVRLVVDVATGAVAQRLAYDAWGQITENTSPGFQPFGYAGGLLDEATGLTRFGARDYDSDIGRWLSKDPAGFAAGDTYLYAYAASSPLNANDPSGLVPDWIINNFTVGVMFHEWVTGLGKERREFGPSSPLTRDMMTDPFVSQARVAYTQKYAREIATNQALGPWDKWRSFKGPEYVDAGPHMPRQFVGSFRLRIDPVDNNTIRFTIDNTTSWESFWRFLGDGYPRWDRSCFPLFGNIHQKFSWTEPVRDW